MIRLLKATFELPLLCFGVALYHCGLAPLLIWLRRNTPRALMFHAVSKEEDEFIAGLSSNTTPAQFAAQLSFVVKHYSVVPIADYGKESLPPRALIITFDDGFRSVFQNAFPLLLAARVPATCYLCTDTLGNKSLIWLNELIWFLERHGSRAESAVVAWLQLPGRLPRRDLVDAIIARYDPKQINGLLESLRASFGVCVRQLACQASIYLEPEEIDEMARGGMSFGNHTGSHAVLSRLSEEDCREELARARNALDRLPGSILSLAYPFGCSNESTRRIALDLGYSTLLEVEGTNKPVNPLRIGRLNVTSDSPARLFARIELVAPTRFWLKSWFVS